MTTNDNELNSAFEKIALLAPTATEESGGMGVPTALNSRNLTRSAPFLSTVRQPRFAAILFVSLLALSFLSPAVRTTASQFLGLFRVEKFSPISVSPEQIEKLMAAAENPLMPGELVMLQEPGEPTTYDSADQMREELGWHYRGGLPFAAEADTIVSHPGSSGYIKVDLELLRSMLALAGADPALLPESMDGEQIEFAIGTTLTMEWNDGMVYMQTASPEVSYPSDIDPAMVGQAVLQALGMDEDQAYRLANTIDWANTLVVPVPANMASFAEIQVGGTTGLLLEGRNPEEGSVLLWQERGLLQAVFHTDVDQLKAIADELR